LSRVFNWHAKRADDFRPRLFGAWAGTLPPRETAYCPTRNCAFLRASNVGITLRPNAPLHPANGDTPK
jgi:hypothetical protein